VYGNKMDMTPLDPRITSAKGISGLAKAATPFSCKTNPNSPKAVTLIMATSDHLVLHTL